MYDFNYIRAESLAAATEALKQVPEAKPLAGGMTLIPTLKLRLARPEALIDLNGIAELRGISVDKGRITIRAMSRHADVAASVEIRRVLPALAALAGGIGDAQVRNRGTLGGSIANNDPAADYPAAVLGLAATIRTQWREIPAEQFFTGMFSTALKPGELIKEVVFPIAKRAGYAKFANPASRYAMVGVMVAVALLPPAVTLKKSMATKSSTSNQSATLSVLPTSCGLGWLAKTPVAAGRDCFRPKATVISWDVLYSPRDQVTSLSVNSADSISGGET